MGIYSNEKLITEARRLATQYRAAMGKPLGISNEIAEFDAAKLLNLTLCQDRSLGYDAVGLGKRNGKRIQIKGRMMLNEKKSSSRIGQIKVDQDWDSLVLVIMNQQYEPIELFEAERDVILAALNEKKKLSSRHKRGAMSLAKFKVIATCVWEKNEEERPTGTVIT